MSLSYSDQSGAAGFFAESLSSIFEAQSSTAAAVVSPAAAVVSCAAAVVSVADAALVGASAALPQPATLPATIAAASVKANALFFIISS